MVILSQKCSFQRYRELKIRNFTQWGAHYGIASREPLYCVFRFFQETFSLLPVSIFFHKYCQGEGEIIFQFTLPPYTLNVLNHGHINQTIAVERSFPNAVNSETQNGCPNCKIIESHNITKIILKNLEKRKWGCLFLCDSSFCCDSQNLAVIWVSIVLNELNV